MLEEEKYLTLETGEKLYFMPKSADYFDKKTTLIFGSPNSGKTTILNEIMMLLKDIIPIAFVISPTNSSNHTFTDKIPKCCIMDNLTVEWLDSFIKRQVNLTEIYAVVHDLKILKDVYSLIASSKSVQLVNAVISRSNSFLEALDNNTKLNFAKKKAQHINIIKRRDAIIIDICRDEIRKNKYKLLHMTGLTKVQRMVIGMLDVNPNAMLILDDCGSQFKKWFKAAPDLFKKIFYDVRHISLTVVITTQDDKEITSELRKNSFVSFFTTSVMATANFDRSSNSYPKHDRLYAQKAIKAVFHQERGDPIHYQKLCYLRGDTDPFRCIVADLYGDFKFGDKFLWNLDKKMGNADINRKNPFLLQF